MEGYIVVWCLIVCVLCVSAGKDLPWKQLDTRLKSLENICSAERSSSELFKKLESNLLQFQAEHADKEAEHKAQMKALKKEFELKEDEFQVFRTKMTNTQAEIMAKLQQLEDKLQEQSKLLAEKTEQLEITEGELDSVLKEMEIDNNNRIDNPRTSARRQHNPKQKPAGNKHMLSYKNMFKKSQTDGNLSADRGEAQLYRRLVIDRPSDPVAFHAVLNGTKVSGLGLYENIKYDDLILNAGAGYNTNTGTFEAPRSGIYIFSAAVLTANDDSSVLYADLTKNDMALARLHAVHNDGYAGQTAVTVVTQLAAGDQVWVRISGSQNVSIWGEKYSFFSGALLHNVFA